MAQPAGAPSGAGAAKPAANNAGHLKALVKTLQNDAERKKLIDQLNTMIAAQTKAEQTAERRQSVGGQILDFVAHRVSALSQKLVAGSQALTDIPAVYHAFLTQARDPAVRARWLEVTWKVLAAIAAGLVSEWILRRVLARPRSALETRPVESVWTRLPTLLGRTVLDAVPILAFLVASQSVMTMIGAGETARAVTLTMINANVLARLVLLAGRLLLAPGAASLRLVRVSDEDATYLFIWLRRLGEAPIYAFFTVAAVRFLGVPDAAADGLMHVLGLLLMLMAIVFVLQNRAAVAAWLRGEGREGVAFQMLRARIADVWHVLAALYIAGAFVAWALEIEGGFEFVLRATVLTLVILLAARLLLSGLRRGVERLFSLNADMAHRFPGLEQRANRYLPILERTATVVVFTVAGFAVLEAWGIESFLWLDTEFGRRVTGSVLIVALLVVTAVLIWEMVDAAITRYLSGAGGPGTAVGPRARTLLPLLRTVILVTLIAIVTLVALSELGLNIAPLLAGAGVIGLAIGFGSQTLVKDIITGMFILMEDQIAVGDVVKIGSHAGVVETLTLRTIRLRDLAGVVHIVPFSEVTTVENMTKEFSRYVFDVGVAYREDTDEVVTVLRQIGEQMMADPAFRDDIVEPLEVLGVDSFGDNAVIIKARITTKPIRQWAVGREFNRRMKKRFDELGIEIPFPHRTIYFGEDKSGAAPPMRLARATGAPDQASGRTSDTRPAGATLARGTPTPETGGVGAADAE